MPELKPSTSAIHVESNSLIQVNTGESFNSVNASFTDGLFCCWVPRPELILISLGADLIPPPYQEQHREKQKQNSKFEFFVQTQTSDFNSAQASAAVETFWGGTLPSTTSRNSNPEFFVQTQTSDFKQCPGLGRCWNLLRWNLTKYNIEKFKPRILHANLDFRLQTVPRPRPLLMIPLEQTLEVEPYEEQHREKQKQNWKNRILHSNPDFRLQTVPRPRPLLMASQGAVAVEYCPYQEQHRESRNKIQIQNSSFKPM